MRKYCTKRMTEALRISHIEVHETCDLFSSTTLQIYDNINMSK